MKRRQWTTLAGIAILFIFSLYIALPSTPGVPVEIAGRDFSSLAFRQGLDLQGGLHVRFQAKPPKGQELQTGAMQAVKRIIENRVNALGVAEPLIQIQGKDRLIVELPGIDDPEKAIQSFRQTGQLLILNTGFQFVQEGSRLVAEPSQIVLSGRDLEDARLGFDSLGSPRIEFDLKPNAGEKFYSYTGTHIGEVLTIGKVLALDVARHLCILLHNFGKVLPHDVARHLCSLLQWLLLDACLQVGFTCISIDA